MNYKCKEAYYQTKLIKDNMQFNYIKKINLKFKNNIKDQ